MVTDRKYNIPGYIALFALGAVSFVMLVGCYDLFQFMYTVIARLSR